MRVKKFKFIFIFLFTLIFILINNNVIYASEYDLNDLIKNNKIEEIVKYSDHYQLKIKISDTYKEIIEIPLENKEEVELLNKNFNLNFLMVDSNDKNIVIKNDNEGTHTLTAGERLSKYRANNEMSLSDLEIEIKEENVKEIYKKKSKSNADSEYTYKVMLKNHNSEINISGDITTINIPSYIDIGYNTDFIALLICISLFGFLLWLCFY